MYNHETITLKNKSNSINIPELRQRGS